VPVTITLSQPSKGEVARHVGAERSRDGFCFSTTMSFGPGAISATISLPSTLVAGLAAVSSSERPFFHSQLPLSPVVLAAHARGVDDRHALVVALLDQRFQIGHGEPGVLAAGVAQRLIDSRIGIGRSSQNA